jgi:hypothetical protein
MEICGMIFASVSSVTECFGIYCFHSSLLYAYRDLQVLYCHVSFPWTEGSVIPLPRSVCVSRACAYLDVMDYPRAVLDDSTFRNL